MMNIKVIIFSGIALAGTAGLLWTGLTTADAERHDHDPGHEQEEVRSLTQQGDILPLEQVLQAARQQRTGRILETELERDDGRYIYEFEILDESGQVWEMKFDASSGELLEEERED